MVDDAAGLDDLCEVIGLAYGFGEAVTAAATNSLFDTGTEAVVLQASAMGEPIYARMGFRTFTTYTQWAIEPPR